MPGPKAQFTKPNVLSTKHYVNPLQLTRHSSGTPATLHDIHAKQNNRLGNKKLRRAKRLQNLAKIVVRIVSRSATLLVESGRITGSCVTLNQLGAAENTMP